MVVREAPLKTAEVHQDHGDVRPTRRHKLGVLPRLQTSIPRLVHMLHPRKAPEWDPQHGMSQPTPQTYIDSMLNTHYNTLPLREPRDQSRIVLGLHLNPWRYNG
eukprot:CAMPEP_0184687554 /NCGR_PEP_ID=MMETSP0312-20130426/26836_1 /TAXON_ID=31354 /ORGANISM="Compsopogon coeruleus, Strain SAG 36.94" /LENGTH=103 /DNA_ID=CAMNT_0027143829 /DNA_START=40 /DNA_END=351 /DNA_ORIENTATION=+